MNNEDDIRENAILQEDPVLLETILLDHSRPKKAHTPDAPFRSGISGKYKLLIRNVSPKFGAYEYELEDAEGREYKAMADMHFAEAQLLRCMVFFEVKSARLVVSDVAVCKKQDLAIPLPEALEAIPQASSILEIKKSSSKAEQKSAKKPAKPNSLFVLIDELQDNGRKTGPMSDDEVKNLLKQIKNKKASRKGSYRCCGKTHFGLFEFRKHLYECHPIEYNRYFVKALYRPAPQSVMGFGIKKIELSSSNSGSYLPQYEGDHFHLIYTPMGNKR